MKNCLIVFATGFTVFTGPLRAEPITINNPGFEAQSIAAASYVANANPPSGWTAFDPHGLLSRNYNSIGVLNPDRDLYLSKAPEGKNVAIIFLWPQTASDYGKPVGLSQVLSGTLLANTKYTLSVQVGNIAHNGKGGTFNLRGFPGYQVQLLAGKVVLAEDNNTLAPGEGKFLQSTVQFNSGPSPAELGQPLSIRLINLNKNNSGIEVNFDDIKLDAAPVP